MSALTLSLLEPGEEAAWDSFVEESPTGTFFHRAAWKRVIEKAFQHNTFYILARRRGQVCGVFPLTQVKSLLFGHSLISNAFCIHGGPVSDDEATERALKNEAIRIAMELKAGCIESRGASMTSDPEWQKRSGMYFIFRRQLAPDVDANLKAIPHTRRRMVRVARDNGLTSVIDDGVERLHDIYAESVRQLGTPVFSRRYFRLLKEGFGSACDVVTVLHDNRPIASVMSFYFRDEVMTYYGGGVREARDLAGNDFMYWEVMRRACERGVRTFDFGRSKIGTGAYDFKRNWGFKPASLVYEFHPLGMGKIPEINPLNPKYRTAIRLWRKLPLSVTKMLGPAIVRSIG
jgi:FemAB-related protein (PEP-CTERM system-associated)